MSTEQGITEAPQGSQPAGNDLGGQGGYELDEDGQRVPHGHGSIQEQPTPAAQAQRQRRRDGQRERKPDAQRGGRRLQPDCRHTTGAAASPVANGSAQPQGGFRQTNGQGQGRSYQGNGQANGQGNGQGGGQSFQAGAQGSGAQANGTPGRDQALEEEVP